MAYERPSLPPLKTVMGDSMSSPPETPDSRGGSLQPSPREPRLLMDGTYKPPSLYPNKKQRTEQHFHASRGAANTLPPPFLTKISMPTELDRLISPLVQLVQHHGHPVNVSGTPRSPLPSIADPRHSNGASWGRQYSLGARDSYYEHDRSSTTAYASFAASPYSAMCGPDAAGHYHGSGSFFLPAQCDHTGKTRKRSNLPKHSTEQMKQWFDENISNPYPSEEQKAHFAKVTGISMTQVSNWFINHRRRCPELRDKREKNRTGPHHDGDF